MTPPSDIHALRERAADALARSDHRMAIRALTDLVDAGVDPEVDVDVFFELGRVHSAVGEHAKAIAVLEAAAEVLRVRNARTPLARILIFLGLARGDAGDLIAAVEEFDQAERLLAPADWYSRVRLQWARARLVSALGDHHRALEDIAAVIEILIESDATEELARARNLAAAIHLSAGNTELAADQLVKIHESGVSLVKPEDRSIMLANEARVETRRGNALKGFRRGLEALQLVAGRAPQEEARAWWAIAEALSAQGHIEHADAAFTKALGLAESRFALPIIESWLAAMQLRAGRVNAATATRGEIEDVRREVRELSAAATGLRRELARVREEVLGDPRSPEIAARSRRAQLRVLPGAP